MVKILQIIYLLLLMCSSVFSQSLNRIKIIDTIKLQGTIVYDQGEVDNSNIYFFDKNFKIKTFGTYKKWQRCKKKIGNRVLSYDIFKSAIDSSDYLINISSSSKCPEKVDSNNLNYSVIYEDRKHRVVGLPIDTWFYKVLFFDRYLYFQKGKLVYDEFLAFACP